jgi:hypothetical protein
MLKLKTHSGFHDLFLNCKFNLIFCMSHTIYAAKFEQTIIHQHVHLRRKSQSHALAHVLMRLYPIDKSLVCLTDFDDFMSLYFL